MRRSASFMRPQPYGRAGWRGLDGYDAQRGSGSLGDLPDVGHVRRHHGSTRLRFTLDLEPSGAMKLMAPMITRQMRREVAQLDHLKAILERTP